MKYAVFVRNQRIVPSRVGVSPPNASGPDVRMGAGSPAFPFGPYGSRHSYNSRVTRWPDESLRADRANVAFWFALSLLLRRADCSWDSLRTFTRSAE